MWLVIIAILLIALAAGTTGLLVKGLFWLFVVSICVALAALIFAGIWGWMEQRADRKQRAMS
jgi:hypothetical protein